jgi:hypothetical protein
MYDPVIITFFGAVFVAAIICVVVVCNIAPPNKEDAPHDDDNDFTGLL